MNALIVSKGTFFLDICVKTHPQYMYTETAMQESFMLRDALWFPMWFLNCFLKFVVIIMTAFVFPVCWHFSAVVAWAPVIYNTTTCQRHLQNVGLNKMYQGIKIHQTQRLNLPFWNCQVHRRVRVSHSISISCEITCLSHKCIFIIITATLLTITAYLVTARLITYTCSLQS